MVFRSKTPQFANFLWREAADGPARFSARNFLLDGSFGESRADSYLESQASYLASEDLPALPGAADWNAAHQVYLYDHIELRRKPGVFPPSQLDPASFELCPETFRSERTLSTYGRADPNLHLLRIVDLRSLIVQASLERPDSPPSADHVFAAAGRLARLWPDPSAGEETDRLAVRGVLAAFNKRADLRPAFAGFLAEHEEVFRPDFAGSWADELRDRLGLCHFGPQRMLLFSYPVADVPRLSGWRLPRPLATPTVLDGRKSEAFCPAPNAEPCGRLVDLKERGQEPAREVLHPYMDLRLEYLFRAGEITEDAPQDLSDARGSHIRWLRARHSEFALDTDS